MIRNRTSHSCTAKRSVAAMLCLALAAGPLAACSGQQTAQSGAATEQAVVDPSSWKTIGDVFALLDTHEDAQRAAGYDSNYYVCAFNVGDSYYRVVAKMEPQVDEKINNADWSRDDVPDQIDEAVRTLVVESATDITGDVVSQAELDKLVGKTGKQLVDAGFAFDMYEMMGENQTQATFSKGYFSYTFTFDIGVPEDKDQDEGASIMGAATTGVELYGVSNDASDPTKVS